MTDQPKKATKEPDATTPPPGLRAGGTALWNACHGEIPEDWQFDAIEAWHLQAACELRDTLDELRKMIQKHGVLVPGSQGQDVLNPALAEARLTGAAIAQLLSKVRLPDEDGVPESPRSKQARKAANVRWSRAENFSREALEKRRRRGQAH